MGNKDRVSRNIVGGRELLPEDLSFMEQLFFIFSFLLILTAIMTISSTNPIHSVFWLVLVFIYTAAILLSMGLEFLGLILVVIYVGAITILFLFVVMMLDILQLRKVSPIGNITPVLFILFGIVLSQVWFSLGKSQVEIYTTSSFESTSVLTDLQDLSLLLYNEFTLPLLLISLLLLVAMIGAIVLTLDLQHITRRQSLAEQHHRNDSWT
jgi:NADH:ubiquinone oxidoreductase subunit 6 (subunit J)